MQVNRRMVFKEIPDRLTLMRRKIVGDDMDFFAAGLIGNDIVEEGAKFGGGVSWRSLTEYLTCFGVESGIQRERAMSVVLKAMTFRAARRKGKDGILPIQRLNGALFIDAEHHGMLRRAQIQSDNVSSLGFKVRVIGRQIALASMRSQSMLSPHTRDHHVRDMQLRSQFSSAPMRRSITGFALDTPLQDACFHDGCQRCRRLPGATTKQPRQTFLREPLAPTVYEAIWTVQLLADHRPGLTSVQQQYQSRPAGIIGSSRLAADSLRQVFSFRPRQADPIAHTYKYTSVLCVTVH